MAFEIAVESPVEEPLGETVAHTVVRAGMPPLYVTPGTQLVKRLYGMIGEHPGLTGPNGLAASQLPLLLMIFEPYSVGAAAASAAASGTITGTCGASLGTARNTAATTSSITPTKARRFSRDVMRELL